MFVNILPTRRDAPCYVICSVFTKIILTVISETYLSLSVDVRTCSNLTLTYAFFLRLHMCHSYFKRFMSICLLLGTFFPLFRARRRVGRVGARGSAVLPTSVSCLGFSRNIPLPPTLPPTPCMSCSACLIDRAPTLHRMRRHRLVKNKNSGLSLYNTCGPFFRPPTRM